MSTIIPDAVPTDTEIPAEADVVIIGGGIIGVCTALFLAERGVSTVLCEKGLIGAEQSARNWGWVRQMGRDPSEIPLAIASLAIWRDLNRRIGAETGYRETGITYLCRNEREMAEYRNWVGHAKTFRIGTTLLGKRDLAARLPGISDGFVGGMFTASDGRAEPMKVAPAIARAAAAAGARIVTNCAVRSVERRAGVVGSVVTERGEIRCSTVVLAGGAWSRLFAGNIGIDLPQLKVLGSAARIGPVAGVPDLPVGAADFAFRRRLDGGFTIARRNANVVPLVPDSFRLFSDYSTKLITQWRELKLRIGGRFVEEWRTPRRWSSDAISPFERVRVLDPVPVDGFIRSGLDNLTKAFPGFAAARITQIWGGLMDVTPDAVPVIGPSAAFPGLYFASGFSGHGFGIGPGAGEMLAQMITGERPHVDPAPFRYERLRPAMPAAA